MSKLSRKTQLNKSGALVQRLATRQNMSGAICTDEALARGVCSLESLDGAELQEVTTAHTTAQDVIREEVVDSINADAKEPLSEAEALDAAGVTSAGLEAAAIIALAAAKPHEYIRAGRTQTVESGILSFESASSGAHGTISYAKPAVEAFDVQIVDKYKNHSIDYNLKALRQDEFGESFFPTVVLTPDQAFFKATISRVMVYTGAIHTLNGDIAKFDKEHVLDAYRNPEILKNDATELVPYRAENDSNAAVFVSDTLVPVQDRVVAGVAVPTAPLKIGVETDILGLSAHPGLLNGAMLTENDAVDAKVLLSNVYVSVSNGTDPVQVIKFRTLRLPGNQFLHRGVGNAKDVSLAFHSASLVIDKTTVDIAGAAVAPFAALTAAEQTVNLEIELDGRLSLERGTLRVKGGGVAFAKAFDSEGKEIAVPAGISGLTMQVIGYDLDARRTNSNRLSRGLLLDVDVYQEAYLVGLLPPMSIQAPTDPYSVGTEVESLIQATHVAISNSAVTTLLNSAEALKDYVRSANAANRSGKTIVGGDIEGIARLLLTAYYEDVNLVLTDVLANLTSENKLKDVQGIFASYIQDIGHRMIQQSGFAAALEALHPGAKPKLLIGTDSYLPAFMMIQGDTRLAGVTIEHKIVTTQNKEMYGNIILMLTADVDGYDPLNSGNFLWIPEMVSSIPVNRKGATVEETMVQPRYRHMLNVPVMARITVPDVMDVIRSRVLINTN